LSLRVVVSGSAGRMGQALVRLIGEADDLVLHAAYDAGGDPAAAAEGADVIVDFSSPAGAAAAARAAVAKGVALVVGTTGLSPAERGAIEEAAWRVPVVLAPNMSAGANALYRLAAEAARILGKGYQPAIVEAHHRFKRDAPSGTALRLAEALGVPRAEVQSVRGGDVVGDHTVLLLGDGERLELTHRATSRDAFARGALRAARWVAGRRPGLYDMAAVLAAK
jgi:4-hydroxy-tetrahydrodipicolinate reductase